MREQPWMRRVTHQMTKLILGHKDACKARLVLNLSQAKRIECAVRAVIKLYCTDVYFEWVSCLHTPSICWNSFKETEITTIYPMMWNTVELQLVCHSESCHCDVEDGRRCRRVSSWLSVSTAVQFSDRHCNRSFLLLRIVDLVVNVVDVLDVSVSVIVAFPPSERLAFESIPLIQRQILVAVEEACEAPSAFKRKDFNVWRSAAVQLSLLYCRVFQERCDRKSITSFIANIVLCH